MLRRRLLVITTLATIALGSARAEGNANALLAGSTLTCSATSQVAGCYIERSIATFWNLEVTLGVDAQAAYAGGRSGHLAPYVGAAWYAERWSAWLEVYMPHSNVPTVGRADWFRIGFSARF